MRERDFELLYTAEAEPLFAFLAYRTGDRALAEDLLADTFERALRARHRYDPDRGSERTWLYAIALNLLRDTHRRSQAQARAFERIVAQPASGPWEAVERRDDLQRALATLSAEEREAIALRFGADLSVPEIARLLRVPLTTVEGRVYGALRKLRERL